MSDRKKLGRGLEEISHLFLSSEEESPPEKEEPTRRISAVSGIWEIEKPFLLGNIALKLCTEGHRVAVLSFNAKLPSINFLLNIPSGEPALQLVEDGRGLDHAMVEGPMGVQLVTGGGDLSNLVHLNPDRREAVGRWIKALGEKNDFLFLDIPSSFISMPEPMVWTTGEVMVMTSPDVAGLLNAYRMIKAVVNRNRRAQLRLVTYRVKTIAEAEATYEKMLAVTRKYLGVSIDDWGFIFDDPSIPQSVWQRNSSILAPSDSRAGRCLNDISRRIIDSSPTLEDVSIEAQGASPREPISERDDPRPEGAL
jgi:flagellar biosynthesis protein FlhG